VFAYIIGIILKIFSFLLIFLKKTGIVIHTVVSSFSRLAKKHVENSKKEDL